MLELRAELAPQRRVRVDPVVVPVREDRLLGRRPDANADDGARPARARLIHVWNSWTTQNDEPEQGAGAAAWRKPSCTGKSGPREIE